MAWEGQTHKHHIIMKDKDVAEFGAMCLCDQEAPYIHDMPEEAFVGECVKLKLDAVYRKGVFAADEFGERFVEIASRDCRELYKKWHITGRK